MQAVASMSGGGSAVAVDQQDQQFGRTGHKVGVKQGHGGIHWHLSIYFSLHLTMKTFRA